MVIGCAGGVCFRAFCFVWLLFGVVVCSTRLLPVLWLE